MSKMLKAVLAGTTALAIAGGSLVYAQQQDNGGARHQRERLSAEDVAALGDARIAALKAGLKLTAEQEKNWPALEQALKAAAAQRSERYAARASADRPRDPVERLRAQADELSNRGATLKSIADAAGPLYQSLDDSQKRRFALLARLDSGRFGHDMRRHHRGHHMGGMHGTHHGDADRSGDDKR
jgi:zinc resistance-associated protein